MSCEELEKVIIKGDPKRYFQVETQLLVEDKKQLGDFLKRNLDSLGVHMKRLGLISSSFAIT